MSTKKKEEDLYVGLEDPTQLHKTLLESTKGILMILQQFEQLKATNAKKHAEIETLRQITEEISFQVNEVKEKLPKVIIKNLPKDTPKPMKKAAQAATKEASVQTKVGMSKIEKELAEIEAKLSRL